MILTALNRLISFYKSVSLVYNRASPSYCTFLKTLLCNLATVTDYHSTVGAVISSTISIHINVRVSPNNRNHVLLTFPQDRFKEKDNN